MSSTDKQNINNSSNEINNLENSQNNIDNNENINNNILNETDSNKNKLLTSLDWMNYFKQSKINLEEINNALLSNVESIDNENIKLKEALNELIKDLKEKEDSLDESLKIISKLKNNYSNLFHQYQTLEKKYIKLTEENEQLKLEQNILNSKKNLNNESQKNFKDEINRMKKDELNMKNNLVERKNKNIKLLKENAEIKALFEDMKRKNLEYLEMIKDREDLISEYTNQIKKLDNEINSKNEQIKLLVKFSKSINDENKTNVKELTKQACQTIKLFYNYNNQNNINNSENINKGNGIFNEIIKMIFNNESTEDLKLSDNNDININKTKNFKITLKLKEAILDNISFDDVESGNSNGVKEYLINIFIKINLLKLELFSAYLREFHYASFLSNIIEKVNYDSNSSYNLLNLRSRMIEIKAKNEKLLKQNNEMTIKLFELKNKVNELNLYIKKIKNDFETNNKKMKEKIEKIIELYENKIARLSDKISLLYKSKTFKNNNNTNEDDINNNINLTKNNNIFNHLKSEKNISFNIINKSNKNNIIIKPNKNSNQKKIFNFSLNHSIESTHNPNTYTNPNKQPLIDSSMKKLENEKLKEEISHLRGEIKELVKDINKQQKLLSESNLQTKNYCDKCDFIKNLISKSILPDVNTLGKIKNIIMNSSFEEKIKNIIYIICDFINKLLNNNSNLNSIEVNNDDIKTIPPIINNINSTKDIFFSDLNKKLFSSSELKKYHLIYSRNIKNISDLIKIYEKRIDDTYNKINNIKLNFDSTITEENNISFNNKKLNTNERVDNSLYDYKNISDEIIKLKQEKIIIDNTIELIKNFLVMNEKIFYFFIERKRNVEQFKLYSKKIFNIFKQNISYNLEDTSDNIIFLKKLITKLLEENFLKY